MSNLLTWGRRLLLSLFLFSLAPLSAGHPAIAEGTPRVDTQVMIVASKQLDPRAVILRDYFAKYDSPLEDHAQDFIDAADTYNVDWKLVPAIAGVESTFGKNTPGGFNGWGWGVYGDQAIYFGSWREGIFTVTKGLKDNYISKGITDPYQINYTYASSPYWGWKVTYFMNDLENFSKTYPQTANVALDKTGTLNKTAAVSAQLSTPYLTFALNP